MTTNEQTYTAWTPELQAELERLTKLKAQAPKTIFGLRFRTMCESDYMGFEGAEPGSLIHEGEESVLIAELDSVGSVKKLIEIKDDVETHWVQQGANASD